MTTTSRCPVVIVESRILLAESLRHAITDRCPHYVVRAVTHYSEAIKVSPKTRRAAILLVGHSFLVSREATEAIFQKLPHARIIAVDDHPHRNGTFTASQTAVHGYWTLYDRFPNLVRGIETVLEGKPSISPHGRAYLAPIGDRLKRRTGQSKTGLHTLSRRDLEYLLLLLHLRDLERCAKAMNIRPRTVENAKFCSCFRLAAWSALMV